MEYEAASQQAHHAIESILTKARYLGFIEQLFCAFPGVILLL
jgi:hypothetical protein